MASQRRHRPRGAAREEHPRASFAQISLDWYLPSGRSYMSIANISAISSDQLVVPLKPPSLPSTILKIAANPQECRGFIIYIASIAGIYAFLVGPICRKQV